MATRSHVSCSPTLWEPQEREIRFDVQPDPGDTFPFDSFWYLQLASSVMIGLGRHPESVVSDAAAMRKLAAVASEVAGELERRAAQITEAGDG